MPTATKKNPNQTQQKQQPQPGAFFRIPGVGARPRLVEEVGPCAAATTITLGQGQQKGAGFSKFQTLDIDAGFLLELDFTTTFTAGSGKTLTLSQLAPVNMVQLLQVQFESAYSTYRLPGWLGFIMQGYRSRFAPKNIDSMNRQAGANVTPGNAIGSTWYEGITNRLATPNLALNVSTSGTQQTYSQFLEVPVSMYFDLYYELAANGQPMGAPIPRAIVSPQRMAATTRNVIPKVTFNPLMSQADTYDSPVSFASGDTTSTAVGTVNATWFRDCWIPTDNALTEPPGRFWQYSRDYISFQPSGAAQPIIPIDDEVPGQGQVLSLIIATWDPALNSGVGGWTQDAAYQTIELLYGSQVQIYQDTPQSNQYRWALQHNAVLPAGIFGYDLALTEDGRLTNENALNTLVQAGVQVRITYASGSKPSNSATIYVGLEMLKKVGS